jgi:hypothetical protein
VLYYRFLSPHASNSNSTFQSSIVPLSKPLQHFQNG